MFGDNTLLQQCQMYKEGWKIFSNVKHTLNCIHTVHMYVLNLPIIALGSYYAVGYLGESN